MEASEGILGDKLNDLSGQLLNIGHIGTKILILGASSSSSNSILGFKNTVLPKVIFFTLNRRLPWIMTVVPPSGILDHFYDLGYRTNSFQVFNHGIFNITVFLRYNTYQFVSFIGIIYGFYTFIATHGNW